MFMSTETKNVRVKVTRLKSNQFRYSSPQMLQALFELVKDKVVIKCYDSSGKILGTGFIRRLYPENRMFLLSISAPCTEVELELHPEK